MVSEHGGNNYLNKSILDFSANISPFKMSENTIKAVTDSLKKCSDYPDPECCGLSERISVFENINKERIVCGNGAADLIYRISHAFKPKKAVIFAPAFSEYKKALSEIGCNTCEYILYEENDFLISDDIIDLIDLNEPDIVFICTPNNPTGRLVPPVLLKMISELCNKKNIILVCDECFIDLAADGEKYSLKNYFNDNCIVLKAFTKFFAMPGLRLGYALCGSAYIADIIKSTGQYWSVSTPAQTAGIAAIDEYFGSENTLTKRYISEYIKKEREYLICELSLLNIKVFPSDTNFILLKTEYDLYDMLLEKDVLIRDCSNFIGLKKGFYRIAVKTHEENVTLINALREVLDV